MATANKIATKTYCNTVKANSFTDDLTHCVTANVASAAGFSHNATPTNKCVKETNISVRTVTFTAIDLTPFLGSYVSDERTGAYSDDPDIYRRFAVGQVVMLDTITHKLKLFAFSSITDLHHGGYSGSSSLFQDYDGTRFVPLGIVVGVPANEYYDTLRGTTLYGTMCGNNKVACITVMSLRNNVGNLVGLQNTQDLGAYASWMYTSEKKAEFLNASQQMGMEPLTIYNPIAAITSNPVLYENLNVLALSTYQIDTGKYWSIFPMYRTNSSSDLCTTDPILMISNHSSTSDNLLNLSCTAAALTPVTGLKYQMPLCAISGTNGMLYPGVTSMSASASSYYINSSGIGRCLSFDAAHYDSRCTDTSYELFYTGKTYDFRTTSSTKLDRTDAVPCRTALLAKNKLFTTSCPQKLLISPYDGAGTGFNETSVYNKGLLFNSTDFISYREKTHYGISQFESTTNVPSDDIYHCTYCLPTGATYEAFLITQKELTGCDLSFWQQTALYSMIKSHTGNNDYNFSLYTPSLYELFKLCAKYRFITSQLQLMDDFLSSNEATLLTGSFIASCEMDDTLLSNSTCVDWLNNNIYNGDWPDVCRVQKNVSVTSMTSGALNTMLPTIGRLGVGPMLYNPTASTDINSRTLSGPHICSCPYLWTNVLFSSSIMFGYCQLIPFIRIPVDYNGPALSDIWNFDVIDPL